MIKRLHENLRLYSVLQLRCPTDRFGGSSDTLRRALTHPLFGEPTGGGVCRPWDPIKVDIGPSLVTLRSLKTPDFE